MGERQGQGILRSVVPCETPSRARALAYAEQTVEGGIAWLGLGLGLGFGLGLGLGFGLGLGLGFVYTGS